jgi:hypothetical protein
MFASDPVDGVMPVIEVDHGIRIALIIASRMPPHFDLKQNSNVFNAMTRHDGTTTYRRHARARNRDNRDSRHAS